MSDDRFYERRHSSRKKRDKKSKKSDSFIPYQKKYSLGKLLSDVGNRDIARFFESGLLQAKLNVSQPGDIYEQEADRIAKNIVNTNSAQVPKVSRVQSKAGTNDLSVQGNTESIIKSLKGKGNPLNKPIKEYFEPRFGVDLGNVRIHTGNEVNLLARSINAKAFTYGNDIVFGEGQYQPDTTEGKKLIAHELTHTVQQNGGFNDVVQKEECSSNYHSGYSTTTPEEYAAKVISAIENSIQYDDYNKARRGFEVIILLPIDTIFRVLKIISSKNSECYVILKHIRLSGFFDKHQRDILDACFNSVDKNNEIDVDIIKFREDTVSDTIKMLWESIRSIQTELDMYDNNKNKLTELAMYIKSISYKEGYDIVAGGYDLADYHRAKALLQFYENEGVEEIFNKEVKGTFDVNNDSYIPYKGKIFGTIQRIVNEVDEKYKGVDHELALLMELREIKSQIIFDTMASFIYFYKKEKIVNKGGGKYSNDSMYNEDSKQYVIDNYPDMVKADIQDFTTTTNLRNEKVGEFGFLADIHTDFRELSRKSIGDIENDIKDTLSERIKNAKYTIGSLNNDHDLIWELKPAIALSMGKKGISEDSETGKSILGCVQARETFKIFRSIALGILGLAFGIAGYFTAGSAWAALPIIGGVAVSSYDLMIEINDYTFHSAASKSMYDFALSSEPSALGIAFAIVGLALDVVDILTYSSKVLNASRRIAWESTQNLDETIEAQYRLLKDDLRPDVTPEEFRNTVKKNMIKDNMITKVEDIDAYLLSNKHFELRNNAWERYIARGGEKSRDVWENMYDTLTRNRLKGDLAEDIFQEIMLGEPKSVDVFHNGKWTTREVDNFFAPTKTAREIKSGYLKLTEFIRNQIAKDKKLLLIREFYKVEWHLMNGGSARAIQALKDAGFTVIEY